MPFYSKAPLRLGLAGGGTDVSPYCDQFGGAVVNATISLFAHAQLEFIDEEKIYLIAKDRNESQTFEVLSNLPIDGKLDILKSVYNRFQQDYPFQTKGFKLTTFVDVPAGSGLGTSSTLVVAIVGVFIEMLHLKMTSSEIAQFAFKIEREDLQLVGGRQDQYAASFGGINFITFSASNKVQVFPIELQSDILNLLQKNLILYYTNTSRESETIIKEQQKNVFGNNTSSINAMHELKHQAIQIKSLLELNSLEKFGELLNFGFEQKRKMADKITNPLIEDIYTSAIKAGAIGGKISGAGGGGFMIFYCEEHTQQKVKQKLLEFGGIIKEFSFTKQGLQTWSN